MSGSSAAIPTDACLVFLKKDAGAILFLFEVASYQGKLWIGNIRRRRTNYAVGESMANTSSANYIVNKEGIVHENSLNSPTGKIGHSARQST